jgi:hypothetical protein
VRHTYVIGTTGTQNNGVTLEAFPAAMLRFADRTYRGVVPAGCVVLCCVVLCCVALCLFAGTQEKLEFVVVGKSQYGLLSKLNIILFILFDSGIRSSRYRVCNVAISSLKESVEHR